MAAIISQKKDTIVIRSKISANKVEASLANWFDELEICKECGKGHILVLEFDHGFQPTAEFIISTCTECTWKELLLGGRGPDAGEPHFIKCVYCTDAEDWSFDVMDGDASTIFAIRP